MDQSNASKLEEIKTDDGRSTVPKYNNVELQMCSSVPKNDDILKYGALFENLAFLSKYNFILEQTERKT